MINSGVHHRRSVLDQAIFRGRRVRKIRITDEDHLDNIKKVLGRRYADRQVNIGLFPDSNRCIHQVSETDRKCKEVQLFDDEVMEEFLDESGSQSDVVAGGFIQSASTADLKT